MAIKPIKRYGLLTPTGVDPTVGNRMKALAGIADGVRGLAVGVGKAKAESEAPAEALREAREAIEEGRPVEKRGVLEFGADTFNQTAINAHLSQTLAGATEKFAELEDAYSLDPKSFRSKAEAYQKAILSSLPAEAQTKAQEWFSNRIFSTQDKISNNFLRESNNQNINTLDSAVQIGKINIANLAKEGNVELANSEAELLILTMDALADASPKYASIVSEEKRKLKNKIYEHNELYKINLISEKQGISAAMSALDDLLKKPVPQGYSSEELRSFEIKAQQDLNRQNARLKADELVTSKESANQVQNYITAKSTGQPVSEKERASVYEIAKGTALEEKLFLADEVAIFATSSLQSRNEMLDAAKTGGLGRADAYKAMLVANDGVNTQARQDGISLFVSQGLGDQITFNPLAEDLDSAENKEAFTKRQQQAKLASEHYGVSVSPLTDSEANSLSSAVTQMTPVEKIELINLVGSDSALWGQIAPKQQGVFAQAAASGDRLVQQTVFKGQDLLANKLVKTLKIDDGYMSDFNDMVGTIYGPNDKRDTLDTALNYYYGSLEAGEDEYEPSKFKAAVQAVTGGVAKMRGYPTQLPRGIPDYDVDSYFDSLGFSDEKIVAVAGQGNYHLYNDAGIPIYGKNGMPVNFNVTQDKIYEMKAQQGSGLFVEARRKKFLTPVLARDL